MSHLDTGEFRVCGSLIRSVTVVRDLGVMLQSHLLILMKDHMALTVSRYFRQLRLLHRVCLSRLRELLLLSLLRRI